MQIIYWDSNSIYMEHRFISPWDNFVNAIILARTRIIGCNAEQIVEELMSHSEDVEMAKKTKPEIQPDLAKWIESNEISSACLRSHNN